MILATTTESMRSELSKDLEPGEELVAFAYGLSMPSKATADKILRRGLYVFGAIALYFLRDKVIVGVTDRRLLILRLTERYARVAERHALPIEAVSGVEHERGSVYHELRIAAVPKDLRFLFYPAPMGIAGNGEQVLKIEARLARDAADFPMRKMAGGAIRNVAASEAASSQMPAGRSGCRRAALKAGGVVAALVVVLLVWSAVDLSRSSGAADDARRAAAAGDLARAQDAFKQAVDLAADSSRPALYYELAAVQLRCAERESAIQSIRAARKIDPAYRAPAEIAAALTEIVKDLDAEKPQR